MRDPAAAQDSPWVAAGYVAVLGLIERRGRHWHPMSVRASELERRMRSKPDSTAIRNSPGRIPTRDLSPGPEADRGELLMWARFAGRGPVGRHGIQARAGIATSKHDRRR